ncbi:N-acylneuraminate-9-phosphatase [Brachionichthys hirsutus]|uniref:N-acylneuraminate-9-phosphatase n=1 Tax=Brachionichthys hirsutus TaxID=412623 RepID=UPI0036050D67
MDGNVVKAILFDLDDTLIETSRAGAVAIRKASELLQAALGLDDVTVAEICGKFKQKLLLERLDAAAGRAVDEVRAGHWEASLQEAVGGSTRPLAAQCYRLWKDSRLESLSLAPETRRLLRRLRGTHRLLLLTNGDAQVQREKLQAVGCEGFFDAVVIGGEHAEQKPFPSIFRFCFEELGVEAGRCVMVGDSLDTDIGGAFNAGVLATVWISRAGVVPDGSVKPDYTIPTVLDLPAVLEQIESGERLKDE